LKTKYRQPSFDCLDLVMQQFKQWEEQREELKVSSRHLVFVLV
jgi:hypothetical protein